jgi:hypothetical protein
MKTILASLAVLIAASSVLGAVASTATAETIVRDHRKKPIVRDHRTKPQLPCIGPFIPNCR